MNPTTTPIVGIEKKLGINFNEARAAFKALPDALFTELDKANLFYQFRWEKIIEAINNGWRADYLNQNQRKYHTYAVLKKDDKSPSGSGFAFVSYGHWLSNTCVGERLLLENSDNALYAIRTFPEEYLAMTLYAKEGL